MRYFMQFFVNSVERLNNPVYSASPCICTIIYEHRIETEIVAGARSPQHYVTTTVHIYSRRGKN